MWRWTPPRLPEVLGSRPELARRWQEIALRTAGRYPKASEKMLDTLRTLTAAKSQNPDTFVSRLRGEAGRALPVVAERGDLNARLQLGAYFFRNWVFGIQPTSKRPLLPYRYDLNREFLGLLADEASARGVKLLMYVIPLNPQSENPYVPAEYAAFKDWSAEFCRSRGIPFDNFQGDGRH